MSRSARTGGNWWELVGAGGRGFPARMIKGLEFPELAIGHFYVIIVASTFILQSQGRAIS